MEVGVFPSGVDTVGLRVGLFVGNFVDIPSDGLLVGVRVDIPPLVGLLVGYFVEIPYVGRGDGTFLEIADEAEGLGLGLLVGDFVDGDVGFGVGRFVGDSVGSDPT